MTHVVMLISNPFRPDSRMLKQAESLAGYGYKITIVGWDRAAEMQSEETLPGGIHILRIQNVPSTYGIGARQLRRLPGFWRAALPVIRNLSPDLIHCHDFDTLPIGLLLGKLNHIPVIYDAREYYADLVKPRLHGLLGNLLYHTIRFLEPLGARLSSAVITVDESLGDQFRRYNRRVVIIGHYPNREMAGQGAKVFTRPEIRLLYVGRLSVDRGLLVYANLLRLLLLEGVPARLVLAGIFTPAEEEQAFQNRDDGLNRSIDKLGWISYEDIPSLMRSADVGLALLQPVPRYVAALPVKMFEYMAAGLPIIASRFPPIQGVLEKTGAGRTADPTSPQEAANLIMEWYRNPAKAREAGEKGRQAILNRYNWEILADQLNQLYLSLLS